MVTVMKIHEASHAEATLRREDKRNPAPRRAQKDYARRETDEVDVSTLKRKKEGKAYRQNFAGLGYGKRYNYTVNSENDLVIKVLDGKTREEIKQIPSKEVQAFKKAFSRVIASIIEEEV